MHRCLFAAVFLVFVGCAGASFAQGAGELEVCAGDDPKCQTPGTVALSCLGSDETVGNVTLWKDTGDALRVQGGQWQMFHASTDQRYDCANVLVHRGYGAGSGLRVCAGDDRGCQTPGQIAYACFLHSEGVSQPTVYHYTGDAIRVTGGQWRMWYSFNQQSYTCEAVLVGAIPYGSGYGSQLRLCGGDDPTCQTPGAMPLLCDLNGDGFIDPTGYYYTGRSMRVSGGQWQMQYPSQQLYACKAVIVATPAYAPQIAPPSTIVQPTPPAAANALPTGSVIIFDGFQCPLGWTRIGQVNRPGTPVSGMSYCRRY